MFSEGDWTRCRRVSGGVEESKEADDRQEQDSYGSQGAERAPGKDIPNRGDCLSQR
jgi:hypothetical protein